MAILYIRNLDERVMAVLRQQAKTAGTNPTELARRILARYAANPEILGIDDKYRSFTEDIMALYQANMEELKMLMQRNLQLAEVNEQLLQKLEELVEK